MDAEVVRTQYNRKVNILKDQVSSAPAWGCATPSFALEGHRAHTQGGRTLLRQVRATAQSANQERSLGEHAAQLLREDLASAKAALAEAARKESQVST